MAIVARTGLTHRGSEHTNNDPPNARLAVHEHKVVGKDTKMEWKIMVFRVSISLDLGALRFETAHKPSSSREMADEFRQLGPANDLSFFCPILNFSPSAETYSTWSTASSSTSTVDFNRNFFITSTLAWTVHGDWRSVHCCIRLSQPIGPRNMTTQFIGLKSLKARSE